jgi:vacuolar-type H+-ATPase subunit C/Vma6
MNRAVICRSGTGWRLYSSVVQQAPEQTRPLVRQLFRYFEVGNLKAVLRSIQTVSSWNSDIAAWDRVREVLFPFGSFSTIPAQAMVESGSSRGGRTAAGSP